MPIGRHQFHDPPGVVLLRRLELEALLRIERRQVVEEDLVAGFLGRLVVDRVDLDQGEIALALLGRPDLAGDGVAGAQVETADLRGRDIDVIGARQIVVLRRAQKAEAVRQALEHAVGEDQAALFGLRLQDLEDQLLLAQAGDAGDPHVLRDLVEILDTHILELYEVERRGAVLGLLAEAREPARDLSGGRCGGTLLGVAASLVGSLPAAWCVPARLALAAFGSSFPAFGLGFRGLAFGAGLPSWHLRFSVLSSV